jgi:2-iminobutanoate/2-iminopropanoate deaminase
VEHPLTPGNVGRVVDLGRGRRREAVRTDAAPAAIGPYVQGIRSGEAVYTSGQIGLDPATGDLVGGGVEGETRQALSNVRAILEASGVSMDDVVKTTVYLVDMSELPAMNTVYAEFFAASPPARSTLAAASLPRGARIEIDAVAVTTAT